MISMSNKARKRGPWELRRKSQGERFLYILQAVRANDSDIEASKNTEFKKIKKSSFNIIFLNVSKHDKKKI